tara:strand:+ start:588 stop:1547 length:960 start_codon:yes stop_codon:yes gene_type:complete
MNDKNCLVLGATGQDGSLLCKSLINQGFQVFGISRKNIQKCSNHIQLGINNDVTFKQINLLNIAEIKQIINIVKPVEIYNMAAQSSVAKSFIYPKETFESIVTITLNVLEACKDLDYKGRIIFAGSSEMFGEHQSRIGINSDKRPNNPYGIAKLCSYNLVKMYREINQLKCVTGILFNHESQLRDQSFVTQKIIEAVIKCEQDKEYKINLGNLNIFRDWGWAEEYMNAIQLINRSSNPKDYIICTGQKMQLARFVEIAFNQKKLHWKDYVTIDKSIFRPSDASISYGNPKELSKDLNWSASIKGENLIKKLIQKRELLN